MQTEIEAKFLKVDHGALRQALKSIDAKLIKPKRLMRRKNYDFPDGRLRKRGGWVRVRDEGDKTTLSYKQLNDRTLHGAQEVNLTVESFDQIDNFLKAIGLEPKHDQETKRESWRLDDVEIELDEWPWIKPFVEIEGPDEESVRLVANKLGLDWDKVVHGSVEVAYQAEYDVTDDDINDLPVIHFDSPVPEALASRRRL